MKPFSLVPACLLSALLIVLAGCSEEVAITEPPSLVRVYLNGTVYTANDSGTVASALVVKGEDIVYVGDDAGAQAFVSEDSRVFDLAGRMLLPGLHDMHIHPAGIIDRGGCDLDNAPLNLEQLAGFVRGCLDERDLANGEWMPVEQWNFSSGNQPTADLASLRAALDAAAPDNPVILWGSDGHHGAVNSLALQQATNAAGEQVGLTAATITEHFADYRETIGVDASGEPNGELHETARMLVNPPAWDSIAGLSAQDLPAIAAELARSGLTSIQDAALPPGLIGAYRAMAETDAMSFRLSVAAWQDVHSYTRDNGTIDVPAMIDELKELREEYRQVPYIQVETAKVFVDGVMEGNPLNDPPTLPNAASLKPYHQPLFDIDMASERVEIRGYVDTRSSLCQQVRMTPETFTDVTAVEAFREEHGFHPAQCRVSRGVLENPAPFIKEYMRALDEAGFNIHAHVIGDRAVRTALDGFDFARMENPPSNARHSLAHIQLVSPDDFARIGEHGLFLVFTYAWISPEFFYDLTIVPFVDRLESVMAMYDADGYYQSNAYPVAQLQKAGAVLAAGSDAPVDTRDPRPFVNIQQALTRAGEGSRVMNPAARVDVRAILDAYTINGARLFGHDATTGSLEVGKKADLVVLDRDILALVDAGHAYDIGKTQVVQTLFEGRVVYEAR